jgi:hypothetical protein
MLLVIPPFQHSKKTIPYHRMLVLHHEFWNLGQGIIGQKKMEWARGTRGQEGQEGQEHTTLN